MLFQQHYRFLWCLLLVGTTAWIPPPQRVVLHQIQPPVFKKTTTFWNGDLHPSPHVMPQAATPNHDASVTCLYASDKNEPKEKKRFVSRLFQRGRRWRKRFLSKKAIATTLLALSLTVRHTPLDNTALAAPVPEKQIYSLRPGVSVEQAQSQAEGSEETIQPETNDAGLMSIHKEQEANPKVSSKKQPKPPRKKKDAFDYGEVDDEFDEEEVKYEMVGTSTGGGITARTGGGASAGASPAQRKDPLAAIAPTKEDNFLHVKAFGVFVLPIFLFITIRGLIQERRNQVVLKKALDIMNAQKAEYFNVTTSANSTDVEIGDALKEMKKNETKADNANDDEDDDDDDDEDDVPPPPRRKPQGGGDGEGGDGGMGGPSDEDLDRLKNIFNKS